MANVRLIERCEKELMITLSDVEQVSRGKQLAKVLSEIRNEDGRHQMMKASMKSAMTALEAERDKLSLIVSSGEELRMIQCEDRANFDTGSFERVRIDTQEIVYERPLSTQERQLEIPGTSGQGLALVPRLDADGNPIAEESEPAAEMEPGGFAEVNDNGVEAMREAGCTCGLDAFKAPEQHAYSCPIFQAMRDAANKPGDAASDDAIDFGTEDLSEPIAGADEHDEDPDDEK